MWNTIEEFANWYEKEEFPFKPPQIDCIFRTNNASTVVLFREGKFQVELYIVDSNSYTPEHKHPGVESIILYISGEGSTTINEKESTDPRPYFNMLNKDGTSILYKQKIRLNPNDSHGLKVFEKGFAFLSIEKWPENIDPNSVAVHWEGNTTGNLHNETIMKAKKKWKIE